MSHATLPSPPPGGHRHIAGPQRGWTETPHLPRISCLSRNPECLAGVGWGVGRSPRRITGAGYPTGAARGADREPSFLKGLHPSGHRPALGQAHHLEMEGGNGGSRHPSVFLPRTPTGSRPVRPGAHQSTCVLAELELSLRARGWAVLALLLLFPLFHLQHGLQGVGEIAQARG